MLPKVKKASCYWIPKGWHEGDAVGAGGRNDQAFILTHIDRDLVLPLCLYVPKCLL